MRASHGRERELLEHHRIDSSSGAAAMATMTEKTGAPGEDSVLSYVDNMMLSIEEMDPSLSACADAGVARGVRCVLCA